MDPAWFKPVTTRTESERANLHPPWGKTLECRHFHRRAFALYLGVPGVRNQRPTILTAVYKDFSLVTQGKCRDDTFDLGPGRRLPTSFPLPYPDLSQRCKGHKINSIQFNYWFLHLLHLLPIDTLPRNGIFSFFLFYLKSVEWKWNQNRLSNTL